MPIGGGAAVRRIKLALALTLALASGALRAQNSRPIAGDVDFINYLIGNNMTTDAISWLDGQSYAASDTLHFLKGLSLYTAGKLELAADAFSLVKEGSPYYDKSVFFGVVSDAYLGRYDSGLQRLAAYDGRYIELKSYETAALALLKNDKEAYLSAASGFTYSEYAMMDGEKLFDGIYTSRFVVKQKNPALAAAMSAVIPGLGKVYSGRKDEGIAAFMTVGVLAGFTAECWIKKGPTDWRTILFGTLGSLFYIGNIYGSYMSVGIYNDTLRDAQNTSVIFNLHLPIRSIFN